MSNKNIINNIEQVIGIGTKLKGVWWYRGQSKEYYKLIPRVFRREILNNRHSAPLIKSFEFEIVREFKHHAKVISSGLPAMDDHLSWLIFMQHYGAPTRLLDWTENILVALYFAVNDETDSNGALWLMKPRKLNRLNYEKLKRLPLLDDNILLYLSEEYMHRNNKELRKKLGLEEAIRYPMAFKPPLMFPRMNTQFSRFTIHPTAINIGDVSNLMDEHIDLFNKYIIPNNVKNILKNYLSKLGIDQLSLFPELDSLGKVVVDNVEKYFQDKA